MPAHLRQDSAFEKSDHYLEAHQQIDLFAAETAFSLAEILTMFEDSLPALIKQRINYETRRRVLEPFQKVEQPWEQSTHNWSAVCAGSIGACAMYLVDSEEERQLILDKCVKSVSYFVLGLTNEGVCQEGYHYWQYGFGYFIYFADLLKKHTEGKVNLLTLPKINETAQFQEKVFIARIQSLIFQMRWKWPRHFLVLAIICILISSKYTFPGRVIALHLSQIHATVLLLPFVTLFGMTKRKMAGHGYSHNPLFRGTVIPLHLYLQKSDGGCSSKRWTQR